MENEKSGVPLIPLNKFMYDMVGYSELAGILLVSLYAIGWYFTNLHLGMDTNNTLVKTISGIFVPFHLYFFYAFILGLILCAITIPLKIKVFKKPKFDYWILQLAARDTSTEIAAFSSKALYLQYDIALNPKELKDFVDKLNTKSDKFTYYLGKVSVNGQTFELIPVEKQDIPERAVLDTTKDTAWNIIPLGLAVDNKNKSIRDYTWTINTEESRDDIYKTIKAMNIVVAGSTGSGKSVLQQCIIGHISRHSDHFMAIGVDCKMVEFVTLGNVKGFSRVALTVPDAAECISAMQKFMYKRYATMKEKKVNEIYKLKDMPVDIYEFLGNDYQFDELMPVRHNGKFAMLQIEEVYNALERGDEVELLKVVD